MSEANERLHVLSMIENGKITAAEGVRLLQALDAGESELASGADAPLPAGSQADHDAPAQPADSFTSQQDRAGDSGVPASGSEAPSIPPEMRRWRNYWMIPLWIGVGITILGGLLMNSILQASGVGFWFLCGSLPFLIGLAIIVVAWWSRTARWLHLRVDQKPGEKPQHIALSFPVPIRLASWGIKTFGDRIPGLKNTSVDEILTAVETTTNPDNPLFIDVNEDEDGERVRVYIG